MGIFPLASNVHPVAVDNRYDVRRHMSEFRKKVLYISHGHPNFSRGGGELAAYYMYQSMKKNPDYEPYFLARLDDPSYQITHPGSRLMASDKDDHTHFLISNNSNYDYFFHSKIDSELREADLYAAVKEFVLALRPSIVHFQHYIHMGVDLISYIKSLLPDVRILLTLHEYGAICAHDGAMIKTDKKQLCHQASIVDCCRCFPQRSPGHFFLRERLFKSNFAAVDRFLAPSHFLRSRYVEWGIDPLRILFMDYGRPIWTRRERQAKRKGEPFRVAFFGQIVYHKGWDVFLKAAVAYIRQRNQNATHSAALPDIRFSLHGTRQWLTPELSDRLDSLIEAAGEVLHVPGPYDPRNMQDLMSRIDCVVIPSIWWENAPLVIQEAFMAGLPVVCSNIGGMAEKVKDHVNGLHFTVGDHFDLLDRLIELAGTPELYAKLVEGIPSVYSDDEMAGDLHRLYDRLLQQKQDHIYAATSQQ
jgi:glycosyltransferase involved in cell wall biosynthesis